MANIIGVSFFTLAMFVAWFLAAVMANDGACTFVTTHPPVVRVVEQFLMLCWLV